MLKHESACKKPMRGGRIRGKMVFLWLSEAVLREVGVRRSGELTVVKEGGVGGVGRKSRSPPWSGDP